jgi:hypothetical protein
VSIGIYNDPGTDGIARASASGQMFQTLQMEQTDGWVECRSSWSDGQKSIWSGSQKSVQSGGQKSGRSIGSPDTDLENEKTVSCVTFCSAPL